MSNIAILNDIHWGKAADATFMLDYQERFFKHVFIPYVLKHKIKDVYILGDLFDKRKVININTLYRAKEMFFEVLKNYNVTIHILPGNHDCSFKNTNKINSLTTTLKEYENVKIYETPMVVDVDNSISFIPWINGENSQAVFDFLSKTDSKVLCGHLELSGFDMYRGIPQRHGMDVAPFKKFDKVLTGHYHLKSSKDNIHYLGAQFQFTWADCGETKYFHVYDPKAETLEQVENPETLYERIYYDDSLSDYADFDASIYKDKIVELVVIKKGNPKTFDNVLEKMQQITTVDFKVKEAAERIVIEDVDTETIKSKTTKELIEMYIDDIELDVDKDRMKSIISGLYVEAMNEGMV